MRDAQEEIGDTLEDAMDSCELEVVRKQIREEFRYELARRDRQIEALREELKRRVDVYSVKHELEMVRSDIHLEVLRHETRTVEAWAKAFIIGGIALNVVIWFF